MSTHTKDTPIDVDQAARDGFTRRSFLGRAGAGAGAIALSQLPFAQSAVAATSPQNFGRIFEGLPPFAPATDEVRAALLKLGEPGGLLDANDDLAAGPKELIVNPALSVNNPDNPTHTAGVHFFGQFMDHDITFDTTSKLGVTTVPQESPNARTPVFDIDSVYGGGFIQTPQLYNTEDKAKLRIESGGLFEDLPREPGTLTAIIGDPRNDENLIIAGLHCAFILFHNHAVDYVRSQTSDNDDEEDTLLAFTEARRLTTWHYHWLILNQILPLFVGQEIINNILENGPRFYHPPRGKAFMPVEFQTGTWRVGHSMVRPSYRANMLGNNGGPFFGMIFSPEGEGQSDPVDLRGGARAPRRYIGWQTFFDFGDGNVKPNKRMDSHISTPLFHLPLQTIPPHTPPTALPQRNLLRQLTWSLPSGQTLAKKMKAPVLAPSELSELKYLGVGFDTSTPLWYYILKEAQVMQEGLRMGPVGGRIIAETIIGLLQSDPNSWVATKPSWTPTLPPGNTTRTFKVTDFLKFAGVDPATRGEP
jgi:hypothetical protein